MAKNKIQFQKGLSLPELFARFGSEEQCRQELFHLRWPQGYQCPKCGHDQYCEIRGRKLYQCKKCRFQASVTQGTIFAATKLPLHIWLMGIYLTTQSKDGISSLNLGRSLGISSQAALRMKHKLQQVMKNQDDCHALGGLLLMDDLYWGGKKRDGKRGRGATGKTPLVAALSLSPEGHPLFLKMSQVDGFTRDEITAWSTKYIRPGSLVVSDGLNCFPGVADAECQHEPIIMSHDAEYDPSKRFLWLNTVIGNVKNALRGTYHAVSSRHLPRYLAEFCYRFNHQFELHAMIDHLARAALRSLPVPQRVLKLAEVRW